MSTEDYHNVLQEMYFSKAYELITSVVQGRARMNYNEDDSDLSEKIQEFCLTMFTSQIDNIIRFFKSIYSKDETKKACLLLLTSFSKYFSHKIFHTLNVQWDIMMPIPVQLLNEFTLFIFELIKNSSDPKIFDSILSDPAFFNQFSKINEDVNLFSFHFKVDSFSNSSHSLENIQESIDFKECEG
jgi:hypothetical protein